MEHQLSLNQSFMHKPEMQLALRLLEAPTLELTPLLAKEMEENPLLEWVDQPLPQGPSPDNLEAKPSLADHLLAQLRGEEPPYARLILGYLDDRGLITTPLEEVAWRHGIELEALKKTHTLLQTLEPRGVCATSVQEALLAQLQPGTPPYKLIRDHYDDLLHQRYPLKGEIASLNPHPGAGFSHTASPPLTPDLWIVEEGEGLIASLKETIAIQVAPDYQMMIAEGKIPKGYLKRNLGRAKWIIRALEERGKTLIKVGKLLIATQEPFLRDIHGPLSPLTLTEAACELGLVDSTLSRAVAHKTLAAPRGLLPLRACFSHAAVGETSAHALKLKLQQLISQEDPKTPHSDERLAERLGCSRRVVAKYRDQLGIGNSRERRQIAKRGKLD